MGDAMVVVGRAPAPGEGAGVGTGDIITVLEGEDSSASSLRGMARWSRAPGTLGSGPSGAVGLRHGTRARGSSPLSGVGPSGRLRAAATDTSEALR